MALFKYNSTRLNVLSSGGGTQSNAIIALIYQEQLPKPDLIIMSDTEREASNVFDYQRRYIQPLCDEINLKYIIIKKSVFATYDLTSPSNEPLPGYFSELKGRDKNGECKGKKPAFCSDKWKRDVVQRYLNQNYGERELTRRGVDMWMGISIDEPRRIKITTGKWQRRYPLVDLGITQQQSVKIVESLGLPTPPRSLCYMCPNRTDNMWRWMRDNVPEDFQAACEHEKVIQKQWPHLWLTKYGIPLTMIDF